MSSRNPALLSAALLLVSVLPVPGQTVFSEGLQYPQKMIATPRGSLLVSEGGTSELHTGRVSIVSPAGVRRNLLEGLPAAPGHGVPAFGPTGIALDGRTLYLVIGDADMEVGPPFVFNPAGSSSPLFQSILRVEFSAEPDTIASGFRLAPLDQWTLFDGYDVELRNAAGDRATVQRLMAFHQVHRNILGGVQMLRVSAPYGVALDVASGFLYVVDTNSESLVRVSTLTGKSQVLTRFQPDQRPGPQFVDNVPTAVCAVEGGLLVGFLSGNPFPAGAASVKLWRPSDGGWSKPQLAAGDLSMVTDLVCQRNAAGAARMVTVEYAADPATRATVPSGRVQVHDGSSRRVLASGLNLPVAAALDSATGNLFVATLGGVIFRYPAP
ncbi:MAG: ScyD/ScyE family protein [Bryobacterales bacterium]|nr:ScyD/ScyE family protein [Bryobacterales bacterium]